MGQREAKGHIEGVQKSARLEQVSGFEVLKFDRLSLDLGCGLLHRDRVCNQVFGQLFLGRFFVTFFRRFCGEKVFQFGLRV